jgi:Na+/melibiose symporter-like transporter
MAEPIDLLALPAESVMPERPAGLFTALMVLTQKLGSAVSVLLLGTLLSWSGFAAGGPWSNPSSRWCCSVCW